MSSPYPVQPVHGNLIAAMQDFIGQRTAQEVERGTREFLNQRQGQPLEVDPFGVQRFEGEGQRQFVFGQENDRANENQGWLRGDRAAVGSAADALRRVPGVYDDPTLGAILQGGNNPAILGQVLGMLGNDRSSNASLQNQRALFGEQNVYNTSNRALEHEYRLKEIEAQNQGRSGSAAMTMAQENANRIRQAQEHYQNTSERLPIQQLMLEGVMPTNMSAEQIMAQMATDRAYNEKYGSPLEREQRVSEEIRSGMRPVGGETTENQSSRNVALRDPYSYPTVSYNEAGVDKRIWPDRPTRESGLLSLLDNIERAIGVPLRTTAAAGEDIGYFGAREIEALLRDMGVTEK